MGTRRIKQKRKPDLKPAAAMTRVWFDELGYTVGFTRRDGEMREVEIAADGVMALLEAVGGADFEPAGPHFLGLKTYALRDGALVLVDEHGEQQPRISDMAVVWLCTERPSYGVDGKPRQPRLRLVGGIDGTNEEE